MCSSDLERISSKRYGAGAERNDVAALKTLDAQLADELMDARHSRDPKKIEEIKAEQADVRKRLRAIGGLGGAGGASGDVDKNNPLLR